MKKGMTKRQIENKTEDKYRTNSHAQCVWIRAIWAQNMLEIKQ